MSSEYTIDHEHTDTEGRFIVKEGERELGELRYTVELNGNLNAYRTFTEPELRGKGMARAMLDELVSFALESNAKIIGTCHYVLNTMTKEPALEGLLVK